MASSENTKPGTRGRPALTEDQVEEMRSHIAACARSLFHEHGYAGISMRRLATEAGCTPVTLYRYFENKFEILRRLWADVLNELFDSLDEIAASEPDPGERLQHIAEAYVGFWLDHRDEYFLVFMSGDVSQHDVSLFMDDESLIARFALFATCLSEAVPRPLAAEQARTRAELLISGLNGIAQSHVTMSGYPWTDAGTMARTLVVGVLAGT